MRLIICKNHEELSRVAAEHIKQTIETQRREKGRAVLGLPTGGTIERTYAVLAEAYAKGAVSFKNVVTFNMDEYVGLPKDHPNSYGAFMKTHLFSKVDMDAANANIPDSMAKDIAAECARYEARITEAGGIDLFVGGVGEDGHLAFNEPGSSLASRTREKTLTYGTRLVNARFFSSLDEVPRTAMTVGVQTVMDAREVMLLVSGENKARALHHMVEGSVSAMWTASAVQMHPRAVIVCDEDATIELKVGTVRYFKALQESQR